MVKVDVKRKTLAVAVAGALLGGSFAVAPEVQAAGFIDDSTLTGGVYYWQRERDRLDVESGQYKPNLDHSTFNVNLNFSSGYFADMIGFDVAGFGAVELGKNGLGGPNEIGFASSSNRWGDTWGPDRSGASLMTSALKFKLGDTFWAQGGLIQPKGQTLIAPHWSFMPGTYRGAEGGIKYDFGDAGALAMSYMWADAYKAPWYTTLYDFRENDTTTGIAYLQSVGGKYDFKNNLVLEAAWGESHNYINQYFAKSSYKLPVMGNDLRMSYQFYGTENKGGVTGENKIYDGLAWLQALTFGYTTGPFDLRLEGTMVKADGRQGFFLQRMTPGYATSNGRLDVWWDSRSDYNANGEKALFAGVMYNLKGWEMPGWSVGTSYAYGWDAKPSSVNSNDGYYNPNNRLSESAWNFDVVYTVQEGRAKGTLFKLHYTMYDNHSDIPSYAGGYGNIFQDEKDVKFMVMAPFTIF